MDYDYTFSVIIPVYNTGIYIDDAIRSVLAQFPDYNPLDTDARPPVEIIIVNDGSTDNSGELCKHYMHRHPKFIKYVELDKNFGVSYARNVGLDYASGQFISFLDADDMWGDNAFETAWNCFEDNPDIDIAAFMLEYFDAETGTDHPLNWKFDKDAIINILECPTKIQMHAASCIIRSSAVGDIRFSEKLKYAEDSLFITDIIMKKRKYVAFGTSHYMYRRRRNGSSAIDGCRKDKRYYLDVAEHFYRELVERNINPLGETCPYIHNIAMYDIQWRLKQVIPNGILSDKEADNYRMSIRYALRAIPDNIILSQRNIWSEHKILALSMKYGFDITDRLTQMDSDLFFNFNKVYSVSNGAAVKISYLWARNKMLHIEGIINIPIRKEFYSVYISDQNSNFYDFGCGSSPSGSSHCGKIEDCIVREKECLYGHYYYDRYFIADIPLPEKDILKISFIFSYKDAIGKPSPMSIGFNDTCRLNTALAHGYLKSEDGIIEKRKTQIIVRQNSRFLLAKKNLGCITDLALAGEFSMLSYRLHEMIAKPFRHKKIWIISDREYAAGDNGEAFFRFLKECKNDCGIKYYFAISKHSNDYQRLKDIGECLDPASKKFRRKFLAASKIISSQANEETMNPFGEKKRFISDMIKSDFVFLQHGIIKDDLSPWLNRAGKDIWMFITSTQKEYDSIINGSYGFGPETVKLTGMPRYNSDTWYKKNNGKIAIVPTWRKQLDGMGRSDFRNSDFFQFYQKFINNELLIERMKLNGYVGELFLHPLFEPYADCFSGNSYIFPHTGGIDYNDMITNSDMIVTDYSSLFFDFAYAGKPVVYIQPDREEFFAGHSYKQGYFDYEKDGFGEVAYSMDDAVDAITRAMECRCTVDKKYCDRVFEFFKPKICDCSQKIFNLISLS